MFEKIEQLILYKTPVKNLYTIEELNKKIKKTLEIKKKYEELEPEDRIYRLTQPEIGVDEVWKKSPEESNIEISDLGRIRIEEIIWKQRDIKNKFGYLILDDFRNIPEKYKEYLYQFGYMYNLVASIWLEKHIDDDSIWDVHHISNEGYDNSPSNLIWMKREDHLKINHLYRE